MPSTTGTLQFSRRRVPLLLSALDRLFPPNPGAFMSDDEQTRHEIVKADATMGSYLAELGADRVGELDILDYGCGWGGETLWLAQKARSVCGVDVRKSHPFRLRAQSCALHLPAVSDRSGISWNESPIMLREASTPAR